MTTTPYHLKLKKISGQEVRLLRAVHEYLPAIGIEGEIAQSIKEAVATHAGEAFDLNLEAVHRDDFEAWRSKLPRPVITAVIGMAPLSRKAILEIDGPIAMSAIDRLLGGHSETNMETRILSDTEQGVLQYLILQILMNVHKISGSDPRVHFRFEKFAFDSGEIGNVASPKDGVAVLVFRVKFGGVGGFVRLALPDPFVEEGFINVPASGEERPAEREFLNRRIEKFGYVGTQIVAEAGRSSLGLNDLAALEEGDIILFDHSGIKLSDGRPAGRVVLRVGDGLQGGLDAEIEVDKTKSHCRIVGIHKGD